MTRTGTAMLEELLREEHAAGIRTPAPVSRGLIARRRRQIAGVAVLVFFALVLVTLKTVPDGAGGLFPPNVLRAAVITIAAGFVAYALDKERHLRRLAQHARDEDGVGLVVADQLLQMHALQGSERLRAALALDAAAPSISRGLTGVLAVDGVRVRSRGPRGELPVAGFWQHGDGVFAGIGEALASQAVTLGAPAEFTTREQRTALAVPVWDDGVIVGVVEAVSGRGTPFRPCAVRMMDAYARGAIAALTG
jgi:hypothetical protein